MSDFNSTSLTVARLREVLHYEPETGVFTWKVRASSRGCAGSAAGSLHRAGYLVVKVDNRLHQAHRLAWLHVYGVWPPEDVDHINRTRDDNRIVNLRLASRAENCQNTGMRRNNKLGCKGVCWNARAQKWQAQIMRQSQNLHLGYFDDINHAIAARKKAEEQLHPFAAK